MPKTLFTPVQGLEPFGGVTPVGVQTRVKGGTGPYVPRYIDDDDSVMLLLLCRRGDVTLKELDDNNVLRIDLEPTEILEVVDKQTGYDLARASRSERDRAISEASGHTGTTTGPNGETIHADADGTVLTDAEVAALRGGPAGPSREEAAAWWEEQSYLEFDFADVTVAELVDLVAKLPLNEVEYVEVLDAQMSDDGVNRPSVLEAIRARQVEHADAVNAPGWSPLEAGLPIVEVRRRLATISDRRVLADLLESERNGSGRKRVLRAVDVRLEQVGGEAPSKVEDLLGNLEGSLAAAKAAVPPLPGEDEPMAAVDEEPFG